MVSCASILLVEDDDNDLFFMQVAWRKIGIANPLIVVRDGREAIQYLESTQMPFNRERHPCPRLVLLDISLPILTGFDVLEWIQNQSFTRELVVVMLTSSTNPADMARARALGAADYLVKPCDAAQLIPMLRGLQERWFSSEPSARRVNAPSLPIIRP